MAKPQLTSPQEGVLAVSYQSSDQLLPENLDEVVAAIVAAASKARLVVVHEVSPEVRTVHITVPTFWLDIVSRSDLQLAGMAVISSSLAVRSAANAFGLANQLRKHALQVKAFTKRDEAFSWATGLLPTG